MKKAFTLAEVLITLGIIGVVAAMTIPVLLQNYTEKRTVSILKETQSIIAQSMKMAEEEYGTMDGWVTNPKEDKATTVAYANNLKPFLKLALDCGVNDSEGKCVYKGNYKLKNGTPTANHHATVTFYYKVKLLNGSSIWLRPNKVMNTLYGIPAVANFFIDTNGPNAPNQWGKDLFEFIYYPGVGLIPEGSPGSNYNYKKDCLPKNANGYGCAYYVLTQQNMNYLH